MKMITVLFSSLVVFAGCATGASDNQDNVNEWQKELKGSVMPYCRDLFSNPAIDPIKDKMIIIENGFTTNPSSFSVLSNNNYPTETERNAIRVFAEEREKCLKFADDIRTKYGFPNQLVDILPKLLAQLYNRKITYAGYGEKLDAMAKINSEMNNRIQNGLSIDEYNKIYNQKLEEVVSPNTSSNQPIAAQVPQQQSNANLIAQCKSVMMGRPTKTGAFSESLANAAQCDADPSAHLRPQSQSNLRCVRDITGAVNCNSY